MRQRLNSWYCFGLMLDTMASLLTVAGNRDASIQARLMLKPVCVYVPDKHMIAENFVPFTFRHASAYSTVTRRLQNFYNTVLASP